MGVRPSGRKWPRGERTKEKLSLPFPSRFFNPENLLQQKNERSLKEKNEEKTKLFIYKLYFEMVTCDGTKLIN